MPLANRKSPGPWTGWLAVIGLAVGLLVCPALAAEESGGAEVVSGSIWNAIWALLIFFILLGVLGKYAWKPVVGMLQEREDKIAAALAESEKNRADAVALMEKYRQQLAQAEAEAARLMAQTQAEAEKVRQGIVGQARTEAEDVRKRTVEQIEASKNQAVAGLFAEAATMATRVAGQILRREIRPEDHRQLVQQTLEDLAKEQGARN